MVDRDDIDGELKSKKVDTIGEFSMTECGKDFSGFLGSDHHNTDFRRINFPIIPAEVQCTIPQNFVEMFGVQEVIMAFVFDDKSTGSTVIDDSLQRPEIAEVGSLINCEKYIYLKR